MSYYFSTTIYGDFDNAVNKVTAALATEGFGVLTEIDMKATMRERLDVDFYNYKILSACNPPFAYKALMVDDKLGTLLPCNVIIQEETPGEIQVSALDPGALMPVVRSPLLKIIAEAVRKKMIRAIDTLSVGK
jgi:uncharacterized protein (DUF302 family)